MPRGRLIEVSWTEKGDRYYQYRQAPVLLHIWSESRVYALKRYHLLTVDNGYGTITPASSFKTQRPFGTYFDFERDGLYFSLGNSDRGARYLERVDDFLSKLEPLDAVSRIRDLLFDAQVMYTRGLAWPSKSSELTSLKLLGLAVSDVNLSFGNRNGKDPAPQSPMIGATFRSLRDLEVRRWDWKAGRVATIVLDGPLQTKAFDRIKRKINAQGLDKALLDRLDCQLLDIEREYLAYS